MLVTKSDESPDRNPDRVDLGDVFFRGSSEEECQAYKPVAADSTKEVDGPIAGEGDTAGSLCSGVGGCSIRVEGVAPVCEKTCKEECSGYVESVGDDPVSCKVVDGCFALESSIHHDKHV